MGEYKSKNWLYNTVIKLRPLMQTIITNNNRIKARDRLKNPKAVNIKGLAEQKATLCQVFNII